MALPAVEAEQPAPRVFGRYVLLKPLARGGMGEIYLAKTLAEGGFEKICAVKKIRPDLSADSEFALRFKDEARLAVRLNHGNIAQIYDAGQVGSEYYLTMEYVEGQSVLKLVLRAREVGRFIPPDIALYVVHELCSALGYAHRRTDYDKGDLGLVHRDVNPQNVLVSYHGEVKLIDFGLAASALKSVSTRAGVAMGKAHYMAPEQARGQTLDARTDVYAAGICLYELLTCQRCLDVPKDGTPAEVARAIAMPDIRPPSQVVPGLDPRFDELVMRALARKPEDRFQDAEAFRKAVATVLYPLNPGIGPDSLGKLMVELFGDAMDDERRVVADLVAMDVSDLVREAEAGSKGETFLPGASGAAIEGHLSEDPADQMEDLDPGTVLAGRYEIQERIGSGGMGSVYLANHLDIGRQVAVKILHAGLARNAEVLTRFRREARAASMIGHPNIIQVTDFGQTRGGRSFFVMEYVKGKSLGDIIIEESPLSPRRVARILRQTCSALDAAHAAGIIHRDLKPDNVLLTYGEGGAEIVKVLDFGIAKITGTDQALSALTQSGLVFGTPQYMSPEQAAGQPLDHRADIYSAGILLYQCLTGRLPFAGETVGQVLAKQLSEAPAPPRRHAPNVPEPMELIVLKMLAKNPGDRYPSAAEVDRDLRRFLAGDPVSAGQEARATGALRPPAPPLAAQPRPPGRPVLETIRERTTQHAATGPSPGTIPPIAPVAAASTSGAQVIPEPGGAHPSRPMPALPAPHATDSRATAGPPPAFVAAAERSRRRNRFVLGSALAAALLGTAAVFAAMFIDLNPNDGKPTAVVADGSKAKRRGARPGPRGSAAALGETVTLTFKSDPAGAHVLAGDRDFGTTPTTVDIPKGTLPISFRFVLEGYDIRSYNVVPDADRPVSVDLREKTSPGSSETAAAKGVDDGSGTGGDAVGSADPIPITVDPFAGDPPTDKKGPKRGGGKGKKGEGGDDSSATARVAPATSTPTGAGTGKTAGPLKDPYGGGS